MWSYRLVAWRFGFDDVVEVETVLGVMVAQ